MTSPHAFAGNSMRAAARIDSILRSHYIASSPGAAILIMKGNETVIDKGYGVEEFQTSRAIDGESVFNIASLTKQFTVAAILTLQEKGLLNIEDSVAKFFPEFKHPLWKQVKLRHLMSHSSGIPDARKRNDMEFMLHCTDAQSVEYMRDLTELKFIPGTQYDYINPTFQILYFVIERVSRQSYEDYMKTTFFEPFGMYNTQFFTPGMMHPRLTHGYIQAEDSNKKRIDQDSPKAINRSNRKIHSDDENVLWQEYDYGEETFFATKSDGGIYTSTHDFLLWEEGLRTMPFIGNIAYKPYIKVTGSRYSTYQNRDNTEYGLGWFIESNEGEPLKIYHTGDNGGYQTYAAKFPTANVYIIMFENRNDHDRWNTVKEIEQILTEEEILI